MKPRDHMSAQDLVQMVSVKLSCLAIGTTMQQGSGSQLFFYRGPAGVGQGGQNQLPPSPGSPAAWL